MQTFAAFGEGLAHLLLQHCEFVLHRSPRALHDEAVQPDVL